MRRLTPTRPLVATLPNLTDPALVFEDLIFHPTGPDQLAVDLRWPEAESCINTTAIFRHCTFAPGNGYYFGLSCVRLTNGWNALFDGCNFVGPAGMPEPLTVHGIITDGQSTGVTVINCRFSGLGAAWYAKGEGEGQRGLFNDIVGCRHGFVWWPDDPLGYEPGGWIQGNHFNTTSFAVQMKQRYQVTATDNLCYAGDYFESTKGHPYCAFELLDCYEYTCDDSNRVGRAHAGVRKPIAPYRFVPEMRGAAEPVLMVER